MEEIPGFTLTDYWLGRLLLNLLGYATVFVPGYLIYKYASWDRRADQVHLSKWTKLLVFCFKEHEVDKIDLEGGLLTNSHVKKERTTFQTIVLLCYCVLGLQGSYLTWGLLQEKIMTRDYLNENGEPMKFKDSQFLVFVNRILALALALVYIRLKPQGRHQAPLYKYSYSSFSNVMSSWCQYEALKFVSFPMQVLAKASKIIPVMLMGKVVTNKSYERYEYITAVMISIGMTLFLLGNSEDTKGSSTTLSGIIILIGYMTFDSFTSNWQGALFSQYKMSSIQMMAGVNLFSVLLTSTTLLQQGGFASSFSFMLKYPSFVTDCVFLSVCSAGGQLFIFYTIQQFGPVIFTIIMTVRQCLAILLSCIFYGHALHSIGAVGVIVVFGGVFLRIYCSYRLRRSIILTGTNASSHAEK